MKKILSIPLAMLIIVLSGCKTDEFVFPDENYSRTDDQSNASLTRASEHPQYSLLGWGFDATGDLTFGNSDRSDQVLDIQKVINSTEDLINSRNNIPSVNQTYFYGRDSEDLKVEISKSYGDSVYSDKLFSRELTNSYNLTDIQNSARTFATFDLVIQLRSHWISLPFNLPSAQVDQYLSDAFVRDLNLMTPMQLIERYGTHVMLGVDLGAKLHAKFSCETTEEQRIESIKSGLAKSLFGAFRINVNYGYDINKTTKNTQNTLNYQTIGGSVNHSLTGSINMDGTYSTIDVGPWQQSVDTTNMVVINCPRGKLIPLYMFVSNATKRAQLKTAVDQYIADAHAKVGYFVYRYFNSSLKNHTLTGDWSKWEHGGAGYAYEGILGRFVNPYIDENRWPLYEYFGSKKNDSYFTTTYASDVIYMYGSTGSTSGSGTKYRYGLHGIVGYVYKTQIPGSIPVYCLYCAKNLDHMYTTSAAEHTSVANMRDWSSHGIVFYINPQ